VRFYETTAVIDPQIGESEIEGNIKKIEEFIKSRGGEIVEIEKVGIQKLAYPVQKRQEAYYVVFKHNSPPETIDKLKELLRINEAILLHMVILKSTDKARVKSIKKVSEEENVQPAEESR